MGLWFRWSQPQPRAKILLPKHHPCLCSGCAGIFVFSHTERLCPKKWIAFRLTLVINTFSHVWAVFSSHWLQNHAIFHIFPSTASHLSLWQLLRPYKMSHWVVYCYTGMFSYFLFLFFFLLTSSFAAKSPHTTLLANRHSHHFPLEPTGPHTNYLKGYVAFVQDTRLSHCMPAPPRSDVFTQHAAQTSLPLLLCVMQGQSA